MADESSAQGPSRRSFLGAAGAAALAALLPKDLRLVAAEAMPVVPPAVAGGEAMVAAPPDPFALAATNPNYDTLRRIVGPVVRSKSGRTIVWTERRGADDSGATSNYKVMKWQPETRLERAAADELYELSNWRSWRTEDDLRALLGGPGPWVLRMNVSESYTLLRADAAREMLGRGKPPADWFAGNVFTDDPAEGARVSSEEALWLLPRMMETYPHYDILYFEPVRPEYALKEVRMLRLRPGGWGPETYASYSLEELGRVFDLPEAPAVSEGHPFVKLEDAFLCLTDVAGGPGRAWAEAPARFCWSADCPRVDEPDHDRTCDCVPPEVRDAEGMVLAYLFARRPDDGRYTYLGLGHLDAGACAGAARFRLEPDLKPRVYASVGGFTGWELWSEDEWFRCGPVLRPGSEEEPDAALKRWAGAAAGAIRLRRWGRDELRAELAGDGGAVAYRRIEDDRFSPWLHYVNPDFTGDTFRDVPLDGADGPAFPARMIFRRRRVVDVVGRFFRAGGELPWPDRWAQNPYGPGPAAVPKPAPEAAAKEDGEKEAGGGFSAAKAEVVKEDGPVHVAAAAGDFDALVALLDGEPDRIDAKGDRDLTPLHRAAEAGSADCVRVLLERGASLRSADDFNRQPLALAVEADCPRCVRLLLARGAPTENRSSGQGGTAVFGARSPAVLRVLAEYGADLEVMSANRQYPFQSCAAREPSPGVMEFWLRRGVRVNHAPGDGRTALHRLAGSFDEGKPDERAGVLRCAELLLGHGADANLRDRDGRSALHVAASRSGTDLCRLLLDHGADANARDATGDTPLHLAVSGENEPLVGLLVERGADVNLRNVYRRNAYDLAAAGFPAVVPILAPLWRNVPNVPPTVHALADRLAGTRAVRGAGGLQPCTAREVERLERKFGVTLPGRYREFLRLAGRGAGQFLVGDYFDAFYDRLPEIGQSEEYAGEYRYELPGGYFVFCRNTVDWGMLLFLTRGGADDGGGSEGGSTGADDPPVYYVGESADGFVNRPRKAYDSFAEWLEARVIEFEGYDRQGVV